MFDRPLTLGLRTPISQLGLLWRLGDAPVGGRLACKSPTRLFQVLLRIQPGLQ